MGWTAAWNRNMRLCIGSVGVVYVFCTMYTSYRALKSSPSLIVMSANVLQGNKKERSTNFNLALLNKLEEISHDLNISVMASHVALYPVEVIGEYVMHNPGLCQDVGVVDFIIMVHTAPSNMERRRRIRESFANEPLFLPFHVRVVFLLGRTTNRTLEDLLRLEHSLNNDSVMGNFIDDYHNLTLKGVMGYRWVSNHCQNSKFVLKIDDDVIVNMFTLLYSHYKHMNRKRSIYCNAWKANSMAILRDGKWQVPKHIFRNRTVFPYTYCSGFVVVISTDLMAPMFQAARSTPFFWIDDVYLFGMLPFVVGGVTFHHCALDTYISLDEEKMGRCLKNQSIHCSMFASLVNSDSTYRSLWDAILHEYHSVPWRLETELVV